MGKEYRLYLNGEEVNVGVDAGRVLIDGEEVVPTSASLDSERKVPFWVVTLLVTLVLTAGTFGAVAVHSLLISPIIAVAAISGCLFVLLATGRSEKVLLMETGDGKIVLSGDASSLKGLHFELAKMVLGAYKGTLGEGSEANVPKDLQDRRRAGSYSAESVLGPEEAGKLRSELGQKVVKRDRIIARTCPHCQGSDLYIEGGMYGGAIYHCKDCDYVGPFIIEREVTLK